MKSITLCPPEGVMPCLTALLYAPGDGQVPILTTLQYDNDNIKNNSMNKTSVNKRQIIKLRDSPWTYKQGSRPFPGHAAMLSRG
jgi:hypothetical protein